jgi:uncharacterized Rmd1/YagE family protein
MMVVDSFVSAWCTPSRSVSSLANNTNNNNSNSNANDSDVMTNPSMLARNIDSVLTNLGVNNNGIRPSERIRKSPANGIRRPKAPRQRQARQYDLQENEAEIFPVTAIHIARKIDLFPLLSSIFARDYIRKQMFNKNSVVIQLTPHAPDDPPRFVAVFRFGSIVSINVSGRELGLLISDIKKHATEPVLNGLERSDNFGIKIRVQDSEDESDEVTGDYCTVPGALDLNAVAVISNIMAQTVALDTYNDTVDDMLAHFATLNATVNKTGKLSNNDKDYLFKTVASNNAIFIDMISKIRIKDRSDTAWNLTKYENIHYGLRQEFEIDSRFTHIEFKLNLVQQNAKFFVEVLQSQKGQTLEWIIVALIGVECSLMIVEMSGLGERWLTSLAQFLS